MSAEPSICMLLKNRLGGDARVKKEARSLRAAGHPVTVICWEEPGRPSDQDWNGIRVVRMRFRARAFQSLTGSLDRGAVPGPAGRLLTVLRRSRARRRAADAFRNALFDIKLISRAVSVGADIYHANDLDTLLPAWIAARAARAGLVYDSHELWLGSARHLRETGALGRIRERLTERLLVRRAGAVIAVTPGRAEAMERMYPGLSVDVVENCPDPAPAAGSSDYLRRAAGVPGGAVIALYQGAIAFERGLENLARACALLDPAGVRVVMIGPDMTSGVIPELAAAEGTRDVMTILPAVPSEELPAVTASADMGLILFQDTCPNHRYSLPNKLYEYMMAGLPVLASDLPEMSRVIGEAGCGALVDPGDPVAIAGAVRKMAADGESRRLMGGRGRIAALERHVWSGQEAILLDLYARVASKLPGAAGRS
jgi:glycosyltransferase involved in cell wall biosynthesis